MRFSIFSSLTNLLFLNSRIDAEKLRREEALKSSVVSSAEKSSTFHQVCNQKDWKNEKSLFLFPCIRLRYTDLTCRANGVISAYLFQLVLYADLNFSKYGVFLKL